jgi:tetratricopeptide (TPR) repeat protein
MYFEDTRTYQTNQNPIEDLVQTLQERPASLVPFIGAGMSMPSGMPGWQGFLEGLIRHGRDSTLLDRNIRAAVEDRLAAVEDRLAAGRFEAAADYLRVALGNQLDDALQREFRLRGRAVQGAVWKVPALATNLIITTNYDRVVETVWSEQLRKDDPGSQAETLTASQGDIERALRGNGRFVLKLHGDVEKPESWILARQQYAAHYDGPGAPVRLFLESFVASFQPLFLGCSLREERIFQAMRSGSGRGYAVIALESEEIQRRLAEELRDIVRIIWLRPDDVKPGGSPYALLEPMLEWVAARAQSRGIIWPSPPPRPTSWAGTLAGLEAKGDYDAAVRWIEERWHALASWELFIERLHFADLLGLPVGEEEQARLLEKVQHLPTTDLVQHGLDFYSARLSGHEGASRRAVNLYAASVPRRGLGDHYQLRSRYELAQSSFRLEDFERARREFRQLLVLIDPRRADRAFQASLLNFLGTLEVIHVIHDLPFSAAAAPGWERGSAEECLRLAEEQRRLARDAELADAVAWSFAVEAFGREASGEPDEAAAAYSSALEGHGQGWRSTTPSHILIYRAGFERRRGNLGAAAECLDKASAMIAPGTRPKDQARVLEERALLLFMTGEAAAAKDLVRQAARLYFQEKDSAVWIGCPLLKRVRRCLSEYGISLLAPAPHGGGAPQGGEPAQQADGRSR